MKTEIINNGELKSDKINWCKVELVECTSGAIILTTGTGLHNCDNNFSGTILIGDDLHDIGEFSKRWSPTNFKKVTKSIAIKFTPDI